MMGFDDRDYSQEESWSASSQPDNVVTKWFVILTVIIFAMGALTISGISGSSIVFESLSLKAPHVIHGQVWRLLTFAICHHPNDIFGIVFSLLIIWQIGSQLERMYGSREMLVFYPAMAMFVGIIFTMWGFILPLDSPLAGSSVISLGVLTLYATHYPRMEVYILPLISVQLRFLVAIFALFGLYPALRIVQGGGGVIGLAYASPVLSIVFSLAYRHFKWNLAGIVDVFKIASLKRAWRNRAARKRLRVFNPTHESDNLDTKVDAILIKIHENGSESLTVEERAILVKASERAKNRIS
ncbi:MAG: rhomboid family intramembrane serine protease [Planctomycetaceae bacterium]